jgi:hypothetical protein
MRYRANPEIVDAYLILTVGDAVYHPPGRTDPVVAHWFDLPLVLDGHENVKIDEAMVARYMPVPGDYYVVQEDGYAYVNPKAVFERKYSPVEDEGEVSAR